MYLSKTAAATAVVQATSSRKSIWLRSGGVIGLAWALSAMSSSAYAGCEYIVSNQWNTGFTGTVRITNTGTSAINGWNIGWQYAGGDRVTSSWNATLTGSNPYAATGLNWNSTIQPGQSAEFGIQGTKGGATAEIPVITGAACAGGTTSSSSVATSSSSSKVSSSVATSSSSSKVSSSVPSSSSSSSKSSVPSSSSSSVASSVVASSSVASSVSSAAGQQCNWYGTVYPLCVTTANGWGYENNQSCIARTTCAAQPAPYGIVGAGSSSSVTTSSTSSKSSVASSSVVSTSSASSVKSSSSSSVSSSSSSTPIVGLAFRGVSLAGAEFGTAYPGIYEKDYIYPDQTEVDYFKSKSMNTLRVPFSWERLQPTLGSAFDATEFGRLDGFVAATTAKGENVVLDPHNYARWNGSVIGSGVSNAQFADLWSRLATRYKSNSKVIFAIMNEPNTMPTEQWLSAANAAIAAIRAAGATNLVLVPGNAWTGASTWSANWYGTANATVMLGVVDSGNNYAYEVHQYLDSDSSGTSSSCVSTSIGVERLTAFTAWLNTNGKRGFLGEFAGGDNATCKDAVTNMLQYMQSNNNVWIGWTWWAAGPWWADYIYTLEPKAGVDRPQMAWLAPFLF
jgi:endoglucanase